MRADLAVRNAVLWVGVVGSKFEQMALVLLESGIQAD